MIVEIMTRLDEAAKKSEDQATTIEDQDNTICGLREALSRSTTQPNDLRKAKKDMSAEMETKDERILKLEAMVSTVQHGPTDAIAMKDQQICQLKAWIRKRLLEGTLAEQAATLSELYLEAILAEYEILRKEQKNSRTTGKK